MSWGVQVAGFVRKKFTDIWADMKAAWSQEWRLLTGQTPDLSDDNPDVALGKALGFEADLLWRMGHQVWRSGFVQTASGVSLTERVKDRGMVRFPAQPSRGILVVSGSPGANFDAGRLRLTGPNRVLYANAGAFTIPASGQIGVEFVSETEGKNTRLGSGVAYAPNADVTVSSEIVEASYVHGTTATQWVEFVPSETFFTSYQTLPTAEILCPTNITGVKLWTKNDSAEARTIRMQVLFYDANGVHIGGTSIQEFTLQPGETTLSWTNEQISVSGQSFRIVLKVLSGTVLLGMTTVLQSPFVLAGQNQNYSLRCVVVSGTNGRIDGGKDVEFDEELRARHDDELDRGGSSRLGSIRARIRELPDVRSVRVEDGDEYSQYIHVGYWGTAPLVAVAGEIARAKPAGIPTRGNRTVTFTDEFGEEHTIKLSLAREVPVYVEIRLRPQPVGPDVEATAKQTVVEYIGGIDAQNALHDGAPVGATLRIPELLVRLHNSLPAVPGIEVHWGRSFLELAMSDLAFAIDEKPALGGIAFA